MTNFAVARASVSQHKKSLSTRPFQGSEDINTSELTSLNFYYPSQGDRLTDGYSPSNKTEYRPYVKKYSQISSGERRRDTSYSWYNHIPLSSDFRPFLWRFPKNYYRRQWHIKGYVPVVVNTTPFGPNFFDPSFYKFSGPFIFAGPRGLVDEEPSWTVKQRHYLKFNEKLADQKVDVLTSIAEAKSTISMLADAANDVFDFYRAVRKADTKSIKRLFSKRSIKKKISKGWRNKTAESRWLELQYGWSPMIGDMALIFDEIAAGNKVIAPLIKVSHSTLLDPNDHYNPGFFPTHNFKGVLKTSCYYTVSPSGMKQAAQWNLGTNPLLTAWELVPYSFVIDWFIPIGDFLTQFSASRGLEFVSGSSVSHVKFSGEHKIIRRELIKSHHVDIEFSSELRGFTTKRWKHVVSPIGQPTFSGGLSVKRALNALALILILRK